MNKKNKSMNVRTITLTGLFGALSAVLMMISFNVPLMPSFIKMDFSELPEDICRGSVRCADAPDILRSA